MKLLQLIKSFFDNKSNDDNTKNFFKPLEINPATGLPMQGNLDVEGNPMGSNINKVSEISSLDEYQINPINGLPMQGGIDIEGNPMGTDYFNEMADYRTSHYDD